MIKEENLNNYLQMNNYEICLIFTRHGQTDYNIQKKFQGQTDGKLTNNGIEQAISLGKYLKDISFNKAYISDLGRTKETFNNLSKELDNKIEYINYNSLIREKDSRGLTHKNIMEHIGIYKNKNIDRRTHKILDEESWVEVNKRCEQFFDMLINELKDIKIDKTPIKILVVSHGGFLMEFNNFINEKFFNKKPIFKNSIKNCVPIYYGLNLNNNIKINKFDFDN